MKVIFLGVGEALDENLPNVSLLIESILKKNILLDCGFTAPFQLLKYNAEPDFLDFLALTHFHGDHTFGIPALILHLAEGKRIKPLYIVGMPGIESFFKDLMEMAYPGFLKKIPFDLNIISDEREIAMDGILFRFARTNHSIKNFAISVSNGKKRIVFSGDGTPTEECKALYKHADLLIHESYLLEGNIPGHASIKEIIQLSNELDLTRTAFVHINRQIRKNHKKEIENLLAEARRNNPDRFFYLPEPGFELKL